MIYFRNHLIFKLIFFKFTAMNWHMPGSSWQDFDLSAVPGTNEINSPVIKRGMMGECKRRRLNVMGECKRRRR